MARVVMPPGPWGLPLFGVSLFLGKHPQITITKWGSKYGNIFSMYLGPQLTVILNDYDAIKAAYVDQADTFSGRPQNFIIKFLSRGDHGVLITEGPFWREQRRFLMRSFHDLGVGKSRFEQLCLEEAQCLVDAMLTHEQEPFDPRAEIDSSVANIIFALVFGKRFERDDPTLRRFLDNEAAATGALNETSLVQILPFLRHIPPFRKDWQKFQQLMEHARDIVVPEVRKLQQQYDPSQQEPASVVEFFLQRRAKRYGTDAAAAEKDEFDNMVNIVTNVQVLFQAGVGTSVATLTWTILFLLHYPEMQQKCHMEIMERVGAERPVSWDDRASLPYTEAFLHEVWRRANMIPLGVARRTTQPTYLNGYFIPKHTMIMPNMWNVHRDERLWQDPLAFKPERFLALNDDGSGKMIRTLADMPFSTGKRQCTGEAIARMEIFLVLANLLQKLEFLRAHSDKDQVPDINEYRSGTVLQPARPFNVRVRRR